VLYNIGAGIFRAFGDSKSPLFFLISGCLVNIVLDILFVAILGYGVSGAAWATLISQLFSLVLVIRKLQKKTDCCKLRIKDISFDSYMVTKTLKIGFPSGFQSVLYSFSNLVIVSSINSFGTNSAAAWAAYGKLDALFWMIISAFGISITTFVGQNFGAGNTERAQKGVKSTIIMSSFVTIFLIGIYLMFAKYGYMIFNNDKTVIEIGMSIVYTIVPTYITFVPIEILSGAIRGTGKTFATTIITLFGIVGLRIVWIALAPQYNASLTTTLMCYGISWIITSIILIIYYKKADVYDLKIHRK
ncbi:MAG: MATE family efflux transporter, partial [Sphaerochaetaceae bacterium]|nr:MATE family efflux transporter [Sphaerochaetaceae bacterium]